MRRYIAAIGIAALFCMISVIVSGATPWDGDAIHKSPPIEQGMKSPLRMPAICLGDAGCASSLATTTARMCPLDTHDVLAYHLEEYGPDAGGPTFVNAGVGDPSDAGLGDANYTLTAIRSEVRYYHQQGQFGYGLQFGSMSSVYPFDEVGNIGTIGRPGRGADPAGTTMSAWLYDLNPSNLSRSCAYVGYLQSSTFILYLDVADGNRLKLGYLASDATFATMTLTTGVLQNAYTSKAKWNPPPLTEWQYWAVTWLDTGLLNVYRSAPNGNLELVASVATGKSPGWTSGKTSIGPTVGGGTNCTEAMIVDEFRIANVARTQAELQSCVTLATGIGAQ